MHGIKGCAFPMCLNRAPQRPPITTITSHPPRSSVRAHALTCIADHLHVAARIRPGQRDPAVPPISNGGKLLE